MDSEIKEVSRVVSEQTRLNDRIEYLEETLKRASDRFHPVLCDASPTPETAGEDTDPQCVISRGLREAADRVDVIGVTLQDMVNRCQL